jgi:N-acetyl-gamma-glutamyl-phosphate reductase
MHSSVWSCHMTIRAAVAGASGYAGGEILRFLLAHPEIEIGSLTAGTNAGTPLRQHQSHLLPLTDRILEPTDPARLAEHDVVFLALPHGASAAVTAALPERTLVVDCGADHRLTDPAAWREFYGSDHAGSWPYGLPELPLATGGKQRRALVGTRRVAVPGCYPTAVSLGLAPGYEAGLLEDEAVVVAASGVSGAGKSLKPSLLGAEVMGSMSPYAVGGVHRHTPEMEQNLTAAAGEPVRVSFTPTLAPMPRGILATCSARLRANTPPNPAEIREIWQDAYGQELFVHLLPENTWPRTGDTLGANVLHVQVTVDRRAHRLIVTTACDNLAKGTAGAAVQCTNIALGLPESLGLPTAGCH